MNVDIFISGHNAAKIQWILTNLFETCVYSYPEMLAWLHLKICRNLVTVD